MNNDPIFKAPSPPLHEPPGNKHIIDRLIEERSENLRQSRFWPLYRAILYPLLLRDQAVKLADEIAPMSGIETLDHIGSILSLDIKATGLANLPKDGRVLIASTHPTGIPDGIAMFEAIKQIRTDIAVFANRDAIRAAPGLEDVIIPVEWVEEKRTRMRSRETLASAIKAFQSESCVILFPSGRLAYMDENKVLTEQEWLASVAIFARKYDCPVLPCRIDMRNSWMYYWFWRVNTELRDMTLFHELLNKKNKTYKFTFGPLIAPDALRGDAQAVADALRAYASHLSPGAAPWEPIAA